MSENIHFRAAASAPDDRENRIVPGNYYLNDIQPNNDMLIRTLIRNSENSWRFFLRQMEATA
jgi:hypothetical protein